MDKFLVILKANWTSHWREISKMKHVQEILVKHQHQI